MAKKRRKQITMRVTVSVPVELSARDARREVRELINHGTGFHYYAGETVICRNVRPAAATKGN